MRKLVIVQAMTFALIGVAIGMGAAFGLALLALVARLIPAIRATWIDPVKADPAKAMRYE